MSDSTTDPEEVRDPEAQLRSQEAARYRTEAKAHKERADAAEAQLGELRSARLESAVYRANAKLSTPFLDADVALRLLDPAAVQWGKDGKPSGVAEALERLAEDYPALLSGAPQEARQASAGMTGNSSRQEGSNLDVAALKKKFPLLRSRG